ncbi:24529_t:CDS:1 [Cetraspora pellucida]|uniref:24529_t:CDS:1 n=1 Tax=Cetraspora pellucida TaxID=1433469 RepID=A0A9N9GJP6_9GLOM|nr:24529_t:CDS:1 [Cetraspora pellucida]
MIYQNQYQTCGGKKEEFEDFRTCAIREAQEEINLKLIIERIQLILKHTYYSHNKSGTKPTTNKDYQEDRINQANLVQIPTYLYWVQYNELNQIKNNEPLKQSNLEWRDYEQCKHLVFTPTLTDNMTKIFKEYIPKYVEEYSKRGKVTRDPYQINQKRKYPKNQRN